MMTNAEMARELRRLGYAVKAPPSDTELAYRLMKYGYKVDFAKKTITPPASTKPQARR